MSDVSGESGAELIFRMLDPSDPDRGAAANTLLINPPPEDCLNPQQKLQVRNVVCHMLAQENLWKASWHLGVFYASLVQSYCDGLVGSQLMLKALEECKDPQLSLQLLFQVRVFCFAHNINLERSLWSAYFRQYQDMFGSTSLPQLNFTPDPKRAVILTAQMLQPPHQPTVDVLAKSSILEQDFGYDVVVLNTCENPHTCDLPVFYRMTSQTLPEYRGFIRDSISGARIFTPTEVMPSARGYAQICAFVQAWAPAFILNFGSFNFSAEYLGRFAHVISMQAGTDLVPTRTSGHLVTFRPLQKADLELLAQFGMSDVPRISSTYCFGAPKFQQIYTRADFDLTADDTVLTVVGTRLDTELDEKNLALLAVVLAQDPRLKIIFAGRMAADILTRISARLPAAQIRTPGFVKDVPSFFANVCDAYLNPVRFGGGGSAAYALAAGLPVFTLNMGHVAANTHPDFVYPSEAALCEAVRDFAEGRGRAEAKAKALARFAQISDRRVMLRDIVAGAGFPTDLHGKAAAE